MDAREVDHKWYDSFDAKRMIIVFDDDVEVPARYEVCEVCEGQGKHVNPSIDSNGITGSEMAELGPDFIEDYVGGLYDVPCKQCHGERVVPVVDEDRCEQRLLKAANERRDSHYDNERERDYERRAGC